MLARQTTAREAGCLLQVCRCCAMVHTWRLLCVKGEAAKARLEGEEALRLTREEPELGVKA